MLRARMRRVLAVSVLLVAMALISMGSLRRHKVYEPTADVFGLQTFVKVSESDINVDATFGGVFKKEGRLVTTYDRSKPRGKVECEA